MINVPAHRIFGTPIGEWIKSIPNELENDAVGLWQIIPVGIEDFGLLDKQLENFCKESIIALIKAGATPVIASNEQGKYWQYQSQYGCDAVEIAEQIFKAYTLTPELASINGLWFLRFNSGAELK